MTQVIYKYALQVIDVQTLQIPEGMEPLHVDMQDGILTLWAKVNTTAPITPYIIYVLGTGHPLPKVGEIYLGTVFDGSFVWHVHWRVGS